MQMNGELHTSATLPHSAPLAGSWVGPKADADAVEKRNSSCPCPGVELTSVQRNRYND